MARHGQISSLKSTCLRAAGQAQPLGKGWSLQYRWMLQLASGGAL